MLCVNRIVYLFISLFCFCSAFASDLSVSVVNVKISGNSRIDDKSVLKYTKFASGDKLKRSDIDRMIKDLYSTKLFEDVSVSIDENRHLIIIVKENPVVRNVIIKGSKFFSEKKLKDNIIKLKPLGIFTKEAIQNDLENLLEFYKSQGRIFVSVDYKVVNLNHNRVDVIFFIRNEYTVQIKDIKFIGNRFFSTKKLSSVLFSHKTTFYNFFTNGVKYSRENIEIDKTLLNRFYQSNGFVDFDVRSVVARLTDDLSGISLIFSIYEGEKYLLGKQEVTFIDDSYDVGLRMGIEKILNETVLGGDFDENLVSDCIKKITFYLSENGHFFPEIRPELKRRDGNIIDVSYMIKSGSRIHINSLNIYGNKVTDDAVIRSRMVINEGDSYNAQSIIRSQRRLSNLGIFKSLNIEQQKINDDLIDLNVFIEERQTGSLNFAFGLNQYTEFMGMIDYRERNAFGTGNELSVSFKKSSSFLLTDLEFINNRIFTDDTALGFRFFRSSEIRANNRNVIDLGLNIQLLNNLTDDLKMTLRYTYKSTTNKDMTGDSRDSLKSRDIFYSARSSSSRNDLISSFSYSLIYNKLSDYYNPKRGFLLKLLQDISGFGGTIHQLKTEVSGVVYVPILNKITDNLTFKIRSSFGYMFSYYKNEDITSSQKFFAGPNEIRGFEVFGIGPRDPLTNNSLGGDFYSFNSFQLNFPLGFPDYLQLKGSLFFDTAMLFDVKEKKNSSYYNSRMLRMSYGFGFSFNSPMGVIRVDFGFPLKKEDYDVSRIPSFSQERPDAEM